MNVCCASMLMHSQRRYVVYPPETGGELVRERAKDRGYKVDVGPTSSLPKF